jgi:site-specific DNA-methyltransferase (adenine-specific)
VKTIDILKVTVPESRQRTTFPQKEHEDLIASIRELSLLQPPVLRNGSVLAAGERRLRACMQIIADGDLIEHGGATCPSGHIPYIDLGDLDPIEAAEVELHENIRRVELSWQDRARAIEALRELRERKGDPITDIQLAREAEISPERVGTYTLIARHLNDPDVAKASSAAEARKIIDKKATTEARLRSAFASSPTSGHAIHTLAHADAREFLKTLPAASFDVILTDPPYGVGADTFGEQSSGHGYDDSLEHWLTLMPIIFGETFRVAKPDAHAYFFCDPRNYPNLIPMARRAGWTPWHVPLIWDKGNGTLPEPDFGPRRTYEMIVYLRKGDRKVLQVLPDVLRYAPVFSKLHAAQKPIDLYIDLLSRSAEPGQAVLDCFAGSGTIFPAASRRKLIATGCEQSAESFAICRTRVNEA